MTAVISLFLRPTITNRVGQYLTLTN